jgi:hypothetical protein
MSSFYLQADGAGTDERGPRTWCAPSAQRICREKQCREMALQSPVPCVLRALPTGDIDATWCLRRYIIKPRDGSAIDLPCFLTSCLLPPLTLQSPSSWAWIFKLLRGSGIDSKESIPPAYVAWRAGKITLSYSVPSPHNLFKNSIK